MEERRVSKRQSFGQHIDLIDKGQVFRPKALNMSNDGMYIENVTISSGNDLFLTYSYGLTPFKKHAQVVRQDAQGIGIKFIK